MLILLPPSEGKSVPRRGRRLDLDQLSFAELTPARRQVIEALVDLCTGERDRAQAVLGLSPGLADEVRRDAGLLSAATAPASRIYTGVLYEALGLATLSSAGRRRASSRLLVVSSVFGLLRPGDRIPSYRLSGDVSLPGLGTVASLWRGVLDTVLRPAAQQQLVVDLRSTTYAGFWRPAPAQAERVVRVRVLHETAGRRTIVSHVNKATKGRLVRGLLEDGAAPRSPAAFADALSAQGWRVEPTPDRPGSVDVVVSEL